MTCAPSRPENGEVLIEKIIAMVGSSTLIAGSGRGSVGLEMVSPIATASSPAMATMSPGPAAAISARSSPS
ncbi:hypothetical protein D3C83_125830 [compost metagenome]